MARGDALPAAARPAGRREGSGGSGRPAHHVRQPDLPRPCAGARPGDGGQRPARPAASCWARPTRRNSAPAPTRATPSTAPPATRSTRRGPPPAPPAARRWRWPPAWCRSPPAPTPADRCATRPRSAASSASARRRGWCRTRSAPVGWTPLPVLGPMARTVADAALLLSAMAADDPRDPLATTIHGRRVRTPDGLLSAAGDRPVRAAGGDHAGFRLRPDRAPYRARCSPKRRGLFRHVFARADDATPDCTGADEAFEVLRAREFPRRPCWSSVRTRPDDVGPNVRANVGRGAALLGRGRRPRAGRADRDVPALAGVLRRATT